MKRDYSVHVYGEQTRRMDIEGKLHQLVFDPKHVKLGIQVGKGKRSYVSPISFTSMCSTVDQDCSKATNQLSSHTHRNTRFNNPKNLRIVLGHACNFRCKYCSQQHAKKAEVTEENIVNFLRLCDEKLDYSQLRLIQFWGGEPLLYWDPIRRFIKEFKARRPEVGFSMVTNGSLITDEVVKDILDVEDFGFILSHDGPGQSLRGIDPLRKGSKTRECLLEIARTKNTGDLYRVYSNQGRNFAVNPVITSASPSLLQLVQWYDENIGMAVPIAECIPMIPIQPGTEQYAPYWKEPRRYEAMITRTFNSLPLERFDNYKLMYDLFVNKLVDPNFSVNRTKALCFTTDPFLLTVDIDGNILPCQTFNKNDTLMDGSSANCGNLRDAPDAHGKREQLTESMPPIHNWDDITRVTSGCDKCPGLSMCMGGCPYISDDAHRVDCTIKYHHFRGLLKVFLSKLLQRKITGLRS